MHVGTRQWRKEKTNTLTRLFRFSFLDWDIQLAMIRDGRALRRGEKFVAVWGCLFFSICGGRARLPGGASAFSDMKVQIRKLLASVPAFLCKTKDGLSLGHLLREKTSVQSPSHSPYFLPVPISPLFLVLAIYHRA